MTLNKEAEFGLEVVELLRLLGFETWQEVSLGWGGNHAIDIVGKIGQTYVAIELKTVLNDTVLIQAAKHTKIAHYTYVMVPSTNKVKQISDVKRYYILNHNIGVIAVNPQMLMNSIKKNHIEIRDILNNFHKYSGARVPIKAPLMDIDPTLIEKHLHDDMKLCLAGSQSGGVLTPYKLSCRMIEQYLNEHPNSTRREIWDALGDKLHWANYGSMCSSFHKFGNDLEVTKNIHFGG